MTSTRSENNQLLQPQWPDNKEWHRAEADNLALFYLNLHFHPNVEEEKTIEEQKEKKVDETNEKSDSSKISSEEAEKKSDEQKS